MSGMLETPFYDLKTSAEMRWTNCKENGRWPAEVPKPSIPTRADVVPTWQAWIYEIRKDGYGL